VDLIEALRTTGAVRDFQDAPVPDAAIYRLLDTARFAPNGGNRQAWRVIVVKDPALRRAMRQAYLPGWYQYLAQASAGLTPWAVVTDRELERQAVLGAPELAAAAAEGPGGFAEHFDQVPVMLVLLADLTKLATVDRDCGHYTMVGGASIYPFAWSILLAARTEGLAGVMTTMVVRDEGAVKELLGVPDSVSVAGVLALGVPVKQPTRLRRGEVGSFATVDRFDGAPLDET
jgi:nitroreductase